jgi:ABC-2 type transport system permease protein
MMRLMRSAFVIARRDFAATVLSKTFLFFLLGPLFPLLFGGIFGGIGASVASSREKPVVAVISSPTDFARLSTARERVATAIDDKPVIALANFAPEPDRDAQEKRLLNMQHPPVQAVLTNPFDHPHLTGAIKRDGSTARQLKLLIETAEAAPAEAPSLVVTGTGTTSGSLLKDRTITGQIGQMILFFLTILLSGMLLSQLIEEKSNKIIEVIAAAVPIDALFIGKLFAMLAASLVGIVLWASTGAAAVAWLVPGGLSVLPSPAVGWPAFLALAVVYFAMSYLLLGAVFLTIGAQASTVREVQTMSMPATFAQLMIFAFAASAVGQLDSPLGIGAAIFPLSSPLVMVARAAEQPDLWPHFAALLWQLLWVVLILRVGASLFRKTVMKSGPRKSRWKFGRA